MSIDNRTTLDDCSAVYTSGDDVGTGGVTTAGLFYATSSRSIQWSTADERGYLSVTSVDLSNATCYQIVKDNLIETQTNGGIKFILFDGTNEIGYEVGGSDNTGIPLNQFFNAYKLDVSNSGIFTAHAFAGSEGSLAKGAITGVGYGTFHVAKAVGSIDNCFLEDWRYIINGNAALTINVGTVGTPITLATVSADDITNGWGLVSNPQGSQYNIFGPTEWGDSGTSDSYFSESDAQITLIGTGIGVGNFDMDLIANSTGTNLFQLDNCVIVNLGAVANWDLSDTNFDTMEITTTQFVNNGTLLFPVTGGTSRLCSGSTFVNCGQVTPSSMTFQDNTFQGTTDANGAILLPTSTTNLSGISFISDGTGHAIYITATGSYTLNNFTYTGYGASTTTDAVVYNNSGGAVTLTISGGDTPTFRNEGASTTSIISGVTIRIEGVTEGTALSMVAAETVGSVTIGDHILEGLADNTGAIEDTGFNSEGDLSVNVRARQQGLPNAAIADDNGSLTDQTTAANSSSIDDMTLLPVSPVANEDGYYFGHSEEFSGLKIDISQAGAGTWTIEWQYWNGAWTALSGVTDDTTGFTVAGENYVTWSAPGDWATTTINGQGPFKYVRARLTAFTSITTQPKGRKVNLNVTRYLPYDAVRTVTGDGLTDVVSWNEDTISTF